MLWTDVNIARDIRASGPLLVSCLWLLMQYIPATLCTRSSLPPSLNWEYILLKSRRLRWAECGKNKGYIQNFGGETSLRMLSWKTEGEGKITLGWMLGRLGFEDQRWMDLWGLCPWWALVLAVLNLWFLVTHYIKYLNSILGFYIWISGL